VVPHEASTIPVDGRRGQCEGLSAIGDGQTRRVPTRRLMWVMRVHLLPLEPHAHLAINPRPDREMLLRVLPPARAPVELAEVAVAMGDVGTHA
jgi:hypothetical protein